MIDTIVGAIAIALSILFVAGMIWADSNFKAKSVLLYFIIIGVPAFLVVFYNPFSNLTDWQFGLFGLLAGLAVIGTAYLFNRGRKSSNQ